VASEKIDNFHPRAGSAAHLFVLLWDTLSNILGTAATATLIARAVKRATRFTPALADVLITTVRLPLIGPLSE
jgi:hypothetical protein